MNYENTYKDKENERSSFSLSLYTDRARKVLQLAQKESKDLGHNYVGTEHLLLGLLAESSGIVLKNMGISVEKCREEVLNILNPKEEKEEISLEDRIAKLELDIKWLQSNVLLKEWNI